LFYSDVAKFAPCDLCWYQRILFYPQIFLLGIAWFKKDKNIIDYSLPMIGTGILISIYHNYIYYTQQTSTFCTISAPCTQQYVIGFDFISIPFMSLTVFVVIGLLLLHKKLSNK
jgi:disulfide bond formation protein DsbB